MIHETIKATVEARGWTAYRVARAAGVSVPTVARFLSGERDMRTTSLDAVCGALGLVLHEGGPTADGPVRTKPKPSDEMPAQVPPPAALHTDAVDPGGQEPPDGTAGEPGMQGEALPDVVASEAGGMTRPVASHAEVSRETSPVNTARFRAVNTRTKEDLGPLKSRTSILATKEIRDRWPKDARFINAREAR